MGGGFSLGRTAYVSAAEPVPKCQRANSAALLLRADSVALLVQHFTAQVNPIEELQDDSDELLVSPNLMVSVRSIAAMGISSDIDGIRTSARFLFCRCTKYGTITPIESAFIINECLRSHQFDGRFVRNKLANEMSKMTLELTSEFTDGFVILEELLTILDSIYDMTEKHNTLWK